MKNFFCIYMKFEFSFIINLFFIIYILILYLLYIGQIMIIFTVIENHYKEIYIFIIKIII